MIKTVPERLRDAAKLFEERNATYGGNYRHFGTVMRALFPNGLGPDTHTDQELGRLLLISHLVTKLARYCNSFRRGGHADSLEDLAVYALMTAELDEEDRTSFGPDKSNPPVNPKSQDTYYDTLSKALSCTLSEAKEAALVLAAGDRGEVDRLILQKSHAIYQERGGYQPARAAPPESNEYWSCLEAAEARIRDVCPPWEHRIREEGHAAWRYEVKDKTIVARVVERQGGVILAIIKRKMMPWEDPPAASCEWRGNIVETPKFLA